MHTTPAHTIIENITEEQAIALDNLLARWQFPPLQIWTAFSENCLMVEMETMVIGIEPDGYTHS